MTKTKKQKLPTIAELRKAIKDIEESDSLYRKISDFNGVTITNVSIDKDYDTIEEYQVHYDAKIHFFDDAHEYYNCHMPLKDIMNFLKKPLS